jgi:hypothetical protein
MTTIFSLSGPWPLATAALVVWAAEICRIDAQKQISSSVFLQNFDKDLS